jgi:aerotaxis receptor
MRINLPVTQKEYPFPRGSTIVTTTDPNGRITYCNSTFVEISGFSHDELIGQHQNIVRHPDMPPEAFRDLWATLKKGEPWSAPVKNRRKDGDHYWVIANVTPLLSAGKTVGYLSVRTHATGEQVQAAEALYRRMRSDVERGRVRVRLEKGKCLSAGRLARWVRNFEPGEASRVGLSMAAVALIAVATAGVAGLSISLASAALAWVLAMLWLRSTLFRPLAIAISFVQALAGGESPDRMDVHGDGQLALLVRSLNQLNVNIENVSSVLGQVDGIGASADLVARGGADLSTRTQTQAASLEEVASTLEELAGTLANNADSAHQVSDLASGAMASAHRARDVVRDVVKTMDSIRKASTGVAEIIGVIDELAFQTNILALNAAVEAARAGEQGRGFAVVASEVRALAQRSAASARDIRALIESSVEQIGDGVGLVDVADKGIEEVVSSVQQVGKLIAGISQASQEQATGVAQVSEAVAHLDDATQYNVSLVDEFQGTARSLLGQAETLEQAAKLFQMEPQSVR